MGNRSTLSNWKRNTVIFLGSQTITLLGSSLVQYAIMWYITLNTQSGLMMTIYILCGFLPTFLLSPFAGVWADRYNRKMLIILSDLSIALATLLLAIVLFIGYHAFWLLFLIAAIRAVGGGIQTPAIAAILPQFVPKEHLTKVNGANSSIQSMIMLISPMIAAVLYTFANLEVILLVDVVTAFIACSILLFFFHIPVHQKAREKQEIGYFADLKEGFRFIGKHMFLKPFFIFLAIAFILVAPVSFLTPIQVARKFGEEVWRLTGIEIAFSIGMLLGGAIIAVWGGFKNRIHTICLSVLITGTCIFSLGIIPNFFIYCIFMGIIGIAMPILNTPATVLLQEKVAPDFLGRVFGVMGMISTSMMPLGMLIFGPIADYIEIEWLLVATGLSYFLMGLLLSGNKVLIKAGHFAEKQN